MDTWFKKWRHEGLLLPAKPQIYQRNFPPVPYFSQSETWISNYMSMKQDTFSWLSIFWKKENKQTAWTTWVKEISQGKSSLVFRNPNLWSEKNAFVNSLMNWVGLLNSLCSVLVLVMQMINEYNFQILTCTFFFTTHVIYFEITHSLCWTLSTTKKYWLFGSPVSQMNVCCLLKHHGESWKKPLYSWFYVMKIKKLHNEMLSIEFPLIWCSVDMFLMFIERKL